MLVDELSLSQKPIRPGVLIDESFLQKSIRMESTTTHEPLPPSMTCVRGGDVLRGMDATAVAEQVADQLVAWKCQQARCAIDYRPFDAPEDDPLPRVASELHRQASSNIEPVGNAVRGRTPALVMSLGPVALAPAVTTGGNEPIHVGFAVVKDPTADFVVVAAGDGLDMLHDLTLMGGYGRDECQEADSVLTPHPPRAGVSSPLECVLLHGALHASRTFNVGSVLHCLPDNVWDAIQACGAGWMLVTRADEYVLNPNVAGRHQLLAWHMWACSARPYQPPLFYQCHTRIQSLLEQQRDDEADSADVMMPSERHHNNPTSGGALHGFLAVTEEQRRLSLHVHLTGT